MATDPRAAAIETLRTTECVWRGYGDDMTWTFAQRMEAERIVDALLAAGWTPPATEDEGPRTLTVSWHPDAVQRAVERALAIVQEGDPDNGALLSNGTGRLSWMDLACLVDAGRAFLAEDNPAATDTTTVQRGQVT
jgi:hypothetical protein